MRRTPVGILGGTFNPIHYGHLRSALELRERLGLAEVRLMPAAQPPHRQAPACPASLRADLVSLAVAGEPGLSCDRRELQREGPSYTVDSLQELREELGPDLSLCLIVGADALGALDSWHRWLELTALAHIVVLVRPGWELPQSGLVATWLQQHLSEAASELQESPAGRVILQRLRPLDISSTEIRQLIASGQS
ncbi:MAG: nicotinate-nucleotide adenylyltransferase, partial [Gammaproteobacteria bacterium]|nr:nicotinate-nucleotide adenylyltransferase [Gammaproteobacteria bacterium]